VAAEWLPADLKGLGAEIHARLAAQPQGFRALDETAVALVTAACDRIIPADGTPGALAADVPRFIDTVMAGWETPDDRDRWLDGLTTLDQQARAQYGHAFTACAIDEQDALLNKFDQEVAALSDRDRAAHWFTRLRFLTIYGYCTSEVGMRDELGDWPMPGRYDGNAPYTPRPIPGPAATAARS